jgi:hypothetical protein
MQKLFFRNSAAKTVRCVFLDLSQESEYIHSFCIEMACNVKKINSAEIIFVAEFYISWSCEYLIM